MKSKKSERMNDLFQAIDKLAKVQNQLTRQAERQYASDVEAILRDQCRDPHRIKYTLDGILDFCFDPGMLYLFKKLGRYYFKIDPESTASYVNIYR